MRIEMTKPVPGYPYPGAVSTTHERAFNLIMNDCAVPVDASQAFLDSIDAEKARIAKESGPKSQKRKTKTRKKSQ